MKYRLLSIEDSWPFDQPRNCATLTMRQILDRTEPILVVSHDADDHRSGRGQGSKLNASGAPCQSFY